MLFLHLRIYINLYHPRFTELLKMSWNHDMPLSQPDGHDTPKGTRLQESLEWVTFFSAVISSLKMLYLRTKREKGSD